MRSYLALSVFAVSFTTAVIACGGGGDADPGTSSSSGSVGGDDDDVTSSSSGSSGQTSSSSGGAASSGGSSGASSSGGPIEPGKPGATCETVDDCDDKVCREDKCVEGTATDGVKNGNETGIDCGQSGTGTDTHAPGCTTDAACTVPADCIDQNCVGSKCVAATKTDNIKNGNETGVDCGGSGTGTDTDADPCADLAACGVAGDCLSGKCTESVCQVPTSNDSVKNGNETDVDCGSGPVDGGQVDTHADPCGTQAVCLQDTDCESIICAAGHCQVATCIDSKKNGQETAINCGGPECMPCDDTLACLLPRDCQSGVCTGNSCTPPAKNDGVQNGNETGVDCGKSALGVNTGAIACKDNVSCLADVDCHSGKCGADKKCAVPTSGDQVKNGNETDVDCGQIVNPPADPVYGAVTITGANKCGDTKGCATPPDCISGVCSAAQKCSAPSYTDNVKNGNETDLDCGGVGHVAGTVAQSQRCVADKICVVDDDCKSDTCTGGKCQLARSCDMHDGGDTCGTGDVTWPASATEPTNPLAHVKKHENCCTSIVVNRPDAQGGKYRLDKYQITAGRMRKFIEVLGNGNLDTANVDAWVTAAKAIVQAPEQLAYTGVYPTSYNTPTGANTCGQDGTVQCNYGWAPQLAGFRYNLEPGGAGGFGCFMGPAASGSRTYKLTDAKYRPGESDHLLAQDRLDQKALDCVNFVMLSAFCAWDGGKLELKEEHAYAYGTGTWPWSTSAGYPWSDQVKNLVPLGFTQDTSGVTQNAVPGHIDPTRNPPNAGQLSSFPLANGSNNDTTFWRLLLTNNAWDYSNMYVLDTIGSYFGYNGGRNQAPLPETTNTNADQSFAVAPPGRYPYGASATGHRDLAGNLMEITATSNGGGGWRWSKNGSFEGYVHTPNGVGEDGFAFGPLTKYGRAGGRCARPLDGYPAQQLPKR